MKKNLSEFLLITTFFVSFQSSARHVVIIDKTNPAPKSEREAILILPGFGTLMHNTKSQRENFKNQGYDVFIPDYISRKSLQKCADNVAKFYQKQGLSQYKKVHVLGYIIGSWTLNKWLSGSEPPLNVKTIIYDRSPMQEMAPIILVDENSFLSRVLFGKLIRELAETLYNPVVNDQRNIGLLMECKATKLMFKKRASLSNYPEVEWTVESRGQIVDDSIFLSVNHDDMYVNVQLIAPYVLEFIKNGKFSEDHSKVSCTKNPFEDFEKKD